MQTVQYGPWKIAVDLEKTRAYYATYPKKEEQANRNFALYCERLSEEERAFFDSFGIDPLCCEIEHIGVSRKGNFPCGGFYPVRGTYLERPPQKLITDQPLEEESEEAYPDTRVCLGVFRFEFLCKDYMFHYIPEDLPEGFLCIRFWCEDMKWLLKETPEERMEEPLKFWEIRRIVNEKIAHKKRRALEREEKKRFFSEQFRELGIRAVGMADREIPKYRKRWIREFTPKGTPDTVVHEIKKNCLYSLKYTTFLWHLFSYGYQTCEEEQRAEECFDRIPKDSCVLISNVDSMAFVLENTASLTAKQLERFVDVTVTAEDFSWTYTKTHEYYCGPYFYRK